MSESQSYQKMLQDVESIVEELSASDMDLDDMVKKVETGYELIHKMKARLDQVKGSIDELHHKYEQT
ncbi:MAG: exodeoxyribonuclease VII small subunit [Oligoflexales bacterium]